MPIFRDILAPPFFLTMRSYLPGRSPCTRKCKSRCRCTLQWSCLEALATCTRQNVFLYYNLCLGRTYQCSIFTVFSTPPVRTQGYRNFPRSNSSVSHPDRRSVAGGSATQTSAGRGDCCLAIAPRLRVKPFLTRSRSDIALDEAKYRRALDEAKYRRHFILTSASASGSSSFFHSNVKRTATLAKNYVGNLRHANRACRF